MMLQIYRQSAGLDVPLPGFDFPGSGQHGLHRAHIQAQQVNAGVSVRGQKSRAGGFSSLRVPAGQTQAKMAVLHQQPLTQSQANATERSNNFSLTTKGF